VEIGFQGTERVVAALEEVSERAEGEVMELGSLEGVRLRGFLLSVWLFACDPPFEAAEPFFREAVPKVHPGELSEEGGKLGGLRATWKQNRDNGQLTLHHLAQTDPHFGDLPRSEPILAHQDGGGEDGGEDLLKSLLPRAAWDELPFVQPDVEAPVLQRLPNLAGSRLVLAVVAEEDVEGIGQGSASWFG
jgi:hypothetical protein